ncbi:MAG: phospholipid carrier-dependent glycosyltransferase [Nannocystaceae bacterium]
MSSSTSTRPPWDQAARAALAAISRERWLLLVMLGALIVRLHWNLRVHPLGDYVYSDMNGYVGRANHLLEHGLAPHEYSSFFPYGTHWIVAGMKWAFGAENYDAIGVLYALFGACTVGFAYACARRASAFPWVAPAVGLLGIFYYPHFSLGGYILSEVPFSFFVMGAVLFSLRLADHGRHRDAWGMGVFAAIGMVVRPQMLVSAAFLGVLWLARRKSLPKIRLVHLLQSFVPVVLMLVASSALLRHNTGRSGLISENGSFNLVFGRCHNSKIMSTPDGKGHGRVHFRPPSFLQVRNHEARSEKKGIPPRVALEPALGDELSYPGYIGDRDKHMEFVRTCIDKTGPRKQLEYSVLNATMLWRHNVPWPDSGRSQWRSISRWWTQWHRNLLSVPALLGLGFLFGGRRFIKQALLAVHLLALVVVAAIYFGSIRIRSPYDFIIITLAFEIYGFGLVLLWKGGRALWQRARGRGNTPPTPEV